MVDGLVLSVSRGYDTRDWALPGGHLEPGETIRQAAARELFEETGVRLDIHARLVPIVTGPSRQHVTSTFGVQGRLAWPAMLRSEPFEGYVDLKKPRDLCTPHCSFAPYQAELFRHLGIL